jgi:hypothetical protein
MTLEMWKFLSVEEAQETLLELIKDKNFTEKVAIHLGNGNSVTYTSDEKSVRKIAELTGKNGSIYSEEIAHQLILDFIQDKTDVLANWLVNGLTFKYFNYNAKQNVGFIIDENGVRHETSSIGFRISKDTNGFGEIGFMIDEIFVET